MKKSAFILSLILGFIAFSLILTTNIALSKDNSKVIVYYLHNSFRCPSCHKIENYTKEAINTNFADKLKDGSLVFKVVNFDEKPDKHFVEDYKLYTKSVVLSKVVNGKQVEWKNLDKIWTLLGDKAKFEQYIKTETGNFLKGSK
ncbi:MAG: nitrophenyl compound nitroreductase subunit ArsF family protein [Vampirovibrionia bacterium]